MLDAGLSHFGFRIADLKSMGQGAKGKEQIYKMLDTADKRGF